MKEFEKKYYTIKETCRILGVSASTAARGLKEGKIMPWTAAVRVGRKVYIPAEAVYKLTSYYQNKVG